MQADTIEGWLISRVAAMLNVSEQEVDRTIPFTSLGLDSVTLFGLTGELAEWLGRDLSAPLAWEFPTIEELARQLAAPSDDADERSIPHAPRDQPLPLSYAQERLWLHAQAMEEGDHDFIVQQWIVRGELDVERLKSSLEAVVGRHEILRTTFSEVGGQPVQVIHSPGSVIMYLLDLSDAASPSEEAERQLRGESQRVMNLERGPLFRVVLMRLSAMHYRIIFSIHHLLYDVPHSGFFTGI